MEYTKWFGLIVIIELYSIYFTDGSFFKHVKHDKTSLIISHQVHNEVTKKNDSKIIRDLIL